MSTETSYSWLRKIPKEALTLHEGPLAGHPPEFNIQHLAKELSVLLSKNISLADETLDTRDFASLKEGFSENSHLLPFKIAPLKGLAFLLLPQEAVNLLLRKELPQELHSSIDRDLFAAFKDYLIAETLVAFQKTFPDKNLVPQFAEEAEFPEEDMLTKEIHFKVDEQGFPVRLLITQELLKSWKERYQKREASPGILNEAFVTLHLEAGRVSLKREEFKSLEAGDYVVLDSCQLSPGDNKGRVLLTLHGKPIFRAKIKEGQLKILEYPFLYEDRNPMAKDSVHDEELDDETEEYLDEDETDEELDEAGSHAPAAAGKTVQPKPQENPVKADEIPLDIVVEIGKFKITVQKLSELKPGQVLDLGFNPQDGVDLVINGHLVAKGELLKVGETLGVRILDIAR